MQDLNIPIFVLSRGHATLEPAVSVGSFVRPSVRLSDTKLFFEVFRSFPPVRDFSLF